MTHLSFEGALLLRSRGLNPTLVLAMPCDPANHLDFLRYKYYQTLWDSKCCDVLKLINCPEKAVFAREMEEKMEQLFKTNICKDMIDEIVNDLPAEPHFTAAESTSFEEIEKKSSSSFSGNIKYPKGFSVTFQSVDDVASISQECHFYPRPSIDIYVGAQHLILQNNNNNSCRS